MTFISFKAFYFPFYKKKRKLRKTNKLFKLKKKVFQLDSSFDDLIHPTVHVENSI